MCVFFLNNTATTEIYALSLHDALPIWVLADGPRRAGARPHHGRGPERGQGSEGQGRRGRRRAAAGDAVRRHRERDRKSTRLNSSHANNSDAVLRLEKKDHVRLSTLSLS